MATVSVSDGLIPRVQEGEGLGGPGAGGWAETQKGGEGALRLDVAEMLI